jgi:hypothetical protein
MLLGGLRGQVLPWQTTLRNLRRRLGALKADMFVRSNVTESSLAENMQTAAIHEPGPFPDPAVCVTSFQSRVDFGPSSFLFSHCFHFLCQLCRMTFLIFSSREILCTHQSCYDRCELCGLRLPAKGLSKVVAGVVIRPNGRPSRARGQNMLGASPAGTAV